MIRFSSLPNPPKDLLSDNPAITEDNVADIRTPQSTASLGAADFGVRLNVYGQAQNSSPVLLGYISEDQAGNGVLGNGAFQATPWYLTTNGVGT